MFPRVGSNGGKEVVLGGTCLNGDYTDIVDPEVLRGIMQRCQAVVPSLAGAKVLDIKVGYRPLRKGGARLEREEGSEQPVIVHC